MSCLSTYNTHIFLEREPLRLEDEEEEEDEEEPDLDFEELFPDEEEPLEPFVW